MIRKGSKKPDKKISAFNVTIAIVTGQVGFLTLIIVLAAVFGGLALDNHFHTRPIITIVLLIASIPISVLAMLKLVRSAIARINVDGEMANKKPSEEEPGIGREED